MEVQNTIIKIVKENFSEIDGEQLKGDTELINYFSSISFVKLLFTIEQELGIKIDESSLDINKYKTLKDLSAFINLLKKIK